MLAIRMQRTGRKKQAQFRVIVQESRLTPTSGKVVAHIGSYDPHTKNAILDAEKAKFYLGNGAQPSERVARLFKSQKIDLPKWVTIEDTQSRTTRNPEKLRKNQPAEEAPAEEAVEVVAEATTEEATEAPVEEVTETPTEETTEEVAEVEEAPVNDEKESEEDSKEEKAA